MKHIKKAVSALTAVIISLPFSAFIARAESEDRFFIDGENITRQVDMAVIYNQGTTTGQNQWGYDVIINSENTVTDIIDSGDAEGNDLAIPEGGAVISATGTRTEWLKNSVDTGDILYYDRYTQSLFVCGTEGEFDPYFSEALEIVEHNGSYALSEGENEGRSDYTYKIIIDADGTVIARGDNRDIPEGGTAIQALSAEARSKLIMYAPVGAKCVISDGTATLSYDKSMLDDSLEILINDANIQLSQAKAEFDYVDYTELEELISEAETLKSGSSDYRAVSEMLYRLETEAENMFAETEISELRGGFHIPDETTPTEVRATVLSAKAAGLNSIILKVSNGYGTFIPLPEGDKFSQDAKFGGFDVLQSYIDVCRQEGVALTLCIDVYYNEYAAIASPEWLTESNGADKGLSEKYYSPASEEFKEYFLGYVEYIVRNYDVDSLMFDYLRYPKFTETSDLGYDYTTLQLFAKEYEIPITEADAIKTELFNSDHWTKWIEFKTGLIDSMAISISERIRAVREDITLLAVAERDTVDYFYMQDSLTWIKDKLFDGVCVAVYEADGDELDSLGDNAYYGGIVSDKCHTFAEYTGKNSYFFVGIESSDSYSASVLGKAVSESREIGADGFIVSSLEDFTAQKYSSALSDGVLRGSAVSPLGDTGSAMSEILEFSKLKIHDFILANGGCDEETEASALAAIDKALEKCEEAPLSHEYAQKLESEMAMLFAASNAKASVLKEYEALTKIALLAKSKDESVEPPQQDESDEETVSNNAVDISDSESDYISAEESVETDDTSDAVQADGSSRIEIDMGKILIYAFVSIAGIAVIAAMATGIRRKKAAPKHHHMPKGSAEGYGKEKDK